MRLGWSLLAKLLNLRFLRATYLSFVVAPGVAAVLNWMAKNTSISMHFPLTVALTYFAGVFLAIALAVYDLFVPGIVRRFLTVDEFVVQSAKDHRLKRTELIDPQPIGKESDLRKAWSTADNSLRVRRYIAAICLCFSLLCVLAVFSVQVVSVSKAILR